MKITKALLKGLAREARSRWGDYIDIAPRKPGKASKAGKAHRSGSRAGRPVTGE